VSDLGYSFQYFKARLVMNYRKFVLVGILLAAAFSDISAQNKRREAPIVRQVGRILIEAGDPIALFDFFSAELQLPVAWQMVENQGSTSGGVSAGNVNLEFSGPAKRLSEAARKEARARFSGLSLEPYPLSDALKELKARGIPYGDPQPYDSLLPDGTQGVMWTTVPLPSIAKHTLTTFLFEYSPKFLNEDVRRKQLGNRLTLNNGGPIGVLSLDEIVISAPNADKAAWARLLGEQAAGGRWVLGAGPAIRIVPGAESQIQKIIFKVKSLSQAKTFLAEDRMLGGVSARELTLNRARLQGLDIGLVQ
jgi:hypothetical protein